MMPGDAERRCRTWGTTPLWFALTLTSLVPLPACSREAHEASSSSRPESSPTAVPDHAVLAGVVDVRRGRLAINGPTEIIGSVVGTGFQPGDTVLMKGDVVARTAFGNPQWMSFSFPDDPTITQFEVCVQRPATRARSQTRTVRLEKKDTSAK
jgi:hypothetical protein